MRSVTITPRLAHRISRAARYSAPKSVPMPIVGCRVDGCQQVQARELAGQRLQRVLVRRVIDARAAALQHRDLLCHHLSLLNSEYLENLKGTSDACRYVRTEVAD